MRDSILKARNTEREVSLLPMEASIVVILFKMKYLAKANTFGLMERHMRDNGKKIKCMDMEY